MYRKRLKYLFLFLIFLVTEVLIVLYVHDHFVRPYLGDILVVVVIYFLIKIFLPTKNRWLPGGIFLFATLIETLQYFHLVELLGVENNVFLRILIGSTFDPKDILCYAIGCMGLGLYEWIVEKYEVGK